MDRHADDAGVQEAGFHALANLAFNDNNKVLLTQAGAHEKILRAMDCHATRTFITEDSPCNDLHLSFKKLISIAAPVVLAPSATSSCQLFAPSVRRGPHASWVAVLLLSILMKRFVLHKPTLNLRYELMLETP